MDMLHIQFAWRRSVGSIQELLSVRCCNSEHGWMVRKSLSQRKQLRALTVHQILFAQQSAKWDWFYAIAL